MNEVDMGQVLASMKEVPHLRPMVVSDRRNGRFAIVQQLVNDEAVTLVSRVEGGERLPERKFGSRRKAEKASRDWVYA